MNCWRILKGLQVVTVDDDADNLYLIKVIFEQYNAQVTAVGSAIETFEIIRQSKPNILLCDIAMANEDGFWLIRQIRNLKSPIRRIPVIAVTALASDEVRTKILKSGFSGCVIKPFKPEELITVVSRLMLKTMFDCCYQLYSRKNYRLRKLSNLTT